MNKVPGVLLLSVLLTACAGQEVRGPSPARPVAALGVAEDRDLAAVNQLLTYFDAGTGAWTTPTGEAWQPAVGLDAVINIYERTRDVKYLNVLEKSFQKYKGHRTPYYDDIGWYANAWLRAYDVTGDPKYLSEAKAIFGDLTPAWDGTCGGGLWWNTSRNYKNAITNELFLLAAARLHRRANNGTGPGSYYDWAQREWNWFKNSGMINAQKFVNDGLNGACANNGGITWTYNQGVILGGLVELYRITGDRGYLLNAEQIAEATTSGQVYSGGILREPCEISGNCNNDQLIFKGLFAQGLARLYNADRGNKPQYGTFLTNNANSVWNTSRNASNGLGLRWVGPVGTPNQATQAAATLLLGEVALLNGAGETSNVPATNGTTYEAESATRTNVGTESTFGGYSGSGYVAGWNADGQSVTFNVNAPSARTYVLTLRYAGGAGDASRFLSANGAVRANNLLFTGTGAWGTWNTVSFSVPLNAGPNTVMVGLDSAKGNSNYLNLDRLEVR